MKERNRERDYEEPEYDGESYTPSGEYTSQRSIFEDVDE
jgi:hypothetical protein